MKLTAAQQKQLSGFDPVMQETIKGDTWTGKNAYRRSTDAGALKPFIDFLNEKEVPQKDLSVEGEVIIEADLTKMSFADRVHFHTVIGKEAEKIQDGTAEEIDPEDALEHDPNAEENVRHELGDDIRPLGE